MTDESVILYSYGSFAISPTDQDICSYNNRGVVIVSLDEGHVSFVDHEAVLPSAGHLDGGFGYIRQQGEYIWRSGSDDEIVTFVMNGSWIANPGTNATGNTLVYKLIAGDGEPGIWTSDLDGLISRIDSGWDPTWHPIVDRLLYTVETHNGYGIAEYDCTKDSRTIVWRDSTTILRSPEYSPDGESYAYFKSTDNQDLRGIYIVMNDQHVRLSDHLVYGRMDWGPQGILYVRYCSDPSIDQCGSIWLLDPGTGSSQPLFDCTE